MKHPELCIFRPCQYFNSFLPKCFNMPGYTPYISSFIRNKNGSEALKLAGALKRVTLCVIRLKDHLHSNHRLKVNSILPKSLQFNLSIKSKESKALKIAKKAVQAYIKVTYASWIITRESSSLNKCPKQYRLKLRNMISNLSTPSSTQSNKGHSGKHNGEGRATKRNSITYCYVHKRTKLTSRRSGSWTSLIDLYVQASI